MMTSRMIYDAAQMYIRLCPNEVSWTFAKEILRDVSCEFGLDSYERSRLPKVIEAILLGDYVASWDMPLTHGPGELKEM